MTFFLQKGLREWTIHLCVNVNKILKDPYWYWVYHSLSLVAKSVEVLALSVERILLSFRRSVFRTASIPDLKYYLIQKLLVVQSVVTLFNFQTLLSFTNQLFLQAFAVACLNHLDSFQLLLLLKSFYRNFGRNMWQIGVMQGFFVAGGYFFHTAESHKHHIPHAMESWICRIIHR